jgi:hypothetical protein
LIIIILNNLRKVLKYFLINFIFKLIFLIPKRNILHYTSMNRTAKSVIAATLFLKYDLKLEGFEEFLELFQEV